jgi:ankyrin repeat protein
VEVVRTLVEAGANVDAPDDQGFRSLHIAAQEGHVEVVRTLLEAGADVEASAGDGSRPVHSAAHGGCADTIGALLELGVDLHAATQGGRTALHAASSSEAVHSLLEAGADLHRRTTFGATPLFEAARYGEVPAVTALVQAGACPNASDAVWWIELIVRAVQSDEEAVTALMEAALMEELTFRLEETGHFARTALQIAELAHPADGALRLALTRA